MTTVDQINDGEWQDSVIEAVDRDGDGWLVTHNGGWMLYVPNSGVEPKTGDTLRTYGRGIGYKVRGIAINGQVVRYQTVEESAAAHDAWVAEREQKQRAEADAKRADNDARIAALPREFRARIERFRRVNPDFEWRHQSYELFTCEQAFAIAAAFPNDADGLRAWAGSTDWAAQKRRVPELSDGHSGNTFGAACRLALLFLTRPELVEQEHGALCPLVGCRDYGCYAAEVNAA